MKRSRVIAATVAGAAALTIGAVVVARPEVGELTAEPPIAPPPAAAVESACGLPGTPGPGAAGATTATWDDVAGWPMPVSATDGPGRQGPGPWSCFTRTESGAVLAAYVIAMRAGGLAPDWRGVVREQTMPGPGQAALLESVPNLTSVTWPGGFDVAAYSPEAATVRYRLQNQGKDYSCTMDVRWSAGDWRLVLGDDGSTSSGCVRGVPDTFTPWGP